MARQSSEGPRQPEADALRLLARKPLTEAELQHGLARQGHAPDVVAGVIERLQQAGQLDDRSLALHYIVTRTERLGHGRLRLLGELERRGVRLEVAEAAWELAVREGHIDPAELLRRRARILLRRQRRGPAAERWARVYNALLRAGFEEAAIRSELGPQQADDAPPDAGAVDGLDDEFP